MNEWNSEMLQDIFWRVLNFVLLFGVLGILARFMYKKVRHRLAHGVWPPKTGADIEAERMLLEEDELEKQRKYHANPAMPGSLAAFPDELRETQELVDSHMRDMDSYRDSYYRD
ncbi:MAG: hypothetical protein AB1744_10425 [Candidatus Zixiibacteriota bacterium]